MVTPSLSITSSVAWLRQMAPIMGAAMLLVVAIACVAAAQDIEQRPPIALDVDSAQLVPLPDAAKSVVVANPDIADLQIPNVKSFLLLGKKQGTTTVYVISDTGHTASYTVTVRRQTGELESTLLREVPGAHIQVVGTPSGVVVSGTVSSPLEASRLKTAARQYLGDKEELVFNVSVKDPTQVNLRIRVAEVSRDVDKHFGFNWNAVFNDATLAVGLLTGRAPVSSFGNFIPSPDSLDSVGVGYLGTGGNVNVSALIDALQKEDLVTVLAEPNLTALSGETANFLAGGEFPIPVPQGLDQITIEFKKFGVSVDFTPTVLNADRMSIKVRSEVSELSDSGAITVSSIKVPALSVRRAETTVELASGQSFAIAGLFQNNVTSELSRLPWLGDVPILGALFRSDRFQRNESELVIIVTPYLVRPVSDASRLRLPTDGLDFSGDLERLFLGRMTPVRPKAEAVPPSGDAPPRLRGSAGFMLE